MKFQDPEITKRRRGKREYYTIRPFVPVVQADGTIIRKQKRLKLGYENEMTLSEAKARKQVIMSTINQTQFVVTAQVPFSEIITKYENSRLKMKGSNTRRTYKSLLKNHIKPVFGRRQLCEIDQAFIEAWLASKLHLSWVMRYNMKNLLSSLFTAAKAWKFWAGDNPAKGIDLGPKTAVRSKRLLTPAELQQLLAALPQVLQLIVVFAVLTGLRISEILGLQHNDIDYRTGRVSVQRRWSRGNLAATKTGKDRQVFIGRFAKYLGPDTQSPYVFHSAKGNPLDDRDLDKALRRAAEKTNLYYSGFGFHTFRRMNITWKQELGATPYEAMKAAGHSRPSTTWDYTIVSAEREEKQTDALLTRIFPDSRSSQKVQFSDQSRPLDALSECL